MPITMYTTGTCPYCMRARRLLDNKGVTYTELRVDKNPALWPEMEQRTGRNTVPQIFIGDFHVGGSDDLAALDQQGKLDQLLRRSDGV